MSTPKIQEDCVGITVQLGFTEADGTTPIPLTGSPTVTMRFKNPVTAIVTERSATVVGDGSTGIIEYTTTSDDLNDVGTYKFQGKAVWSSPTRILYTFVKKIKVKANL